MAPGVPGPLRGLGGPGGTGLGGPPPSPGSLAFLAPLARDYEQSESPWMARVLAEHLSSHGLPDYQLSGLRPIALVRKIFAPPAQRKTSEMNSLSQTSSSATSPIVRHLDLSEARSIVEADKQLAARTTGDRPSLDLNAYTTFTYEALDHLQKWFGEFAVHYAMFGNRSCRPVFPDSMQKPLSGTDRHPESRGGT